jgi:hypothetical protein
MKALEDEEVHPTKADIKLNSAFPKAGIRLPLRCLTPARR